MHCRYCGYTSSNIEECDRCGRVFAKNVKVITVKRKKTTEVKNDKDPAISKQNFYGQKLTEQSAPYKGSGDAITTYVMKHGRPITVQGKTHRTPNTKLVRVKKVVPAEPGIVHFTVPMSGYARQVKDP